ncbi:MAG TPA: DUF2480 family protein [Saprospiraceae bacterium]|jgi:hypothetical protein|nr:MAG: DUF2480 family protein [Saprospiraceae bacterium]HNQ42065.1 DUF2480 family protein [Saprospiraceae bacterium]HRN33994.1 DUF2480 family protein [Saprospiraceae bacterium]HRP83947.1 DUF2480 family protein [Saprospiraceae bacterium]
MEKELVNRIANSPLITLDMEKHAPQWNYALFDIKDYLFHGLILKEKDFRQALKELDWTQYEGKDLLVFCSNDAIIPMWAYMLIVAQASPYASNVIQEDEAAYCSRIWKETIDALDLSPYEGKKMIVKGCSDRPVPPSAYTTITGRLIKIAESVMFGEPCSTVPVFKSKSVQARDK